jgi:hypothetical protein
MWFMCEQAFDAAIHPFSQFVHTLTAPWSGRIASFDAMATETPGRAERGGIARRLSSLRPKGPENTQEIFSNSQVGKTSWGEDKTRQRVFKTKNRVVKTSSPQDGFSWGEDKTRQRVFKIKNRVVKTSSPQDGSSSPEVKKISSVFSGFISPGKMIHIQKSVHIQRNGKSICNSGDILQRMIPYTKPKWM